MSSRFPPSSGFSSRGDRSPQRYADRRPVSPPPAGGRDDPNTAPLGREPPRGPKALIDSSRGGYSGGGGRGRGGGYPPSRGGEFRDRDRDRDRDRPGGRDFRDGPPFRRDDRDRDWVRRDRIDRDFDARDGRPAFRRSRSPPPPRDGRDFRDSRDSGSDIVRMRRNSRDSLVSTSSNPNDGPPVGIGPPPHRGGPGRGRGRGDWDGGSGGGRGRGRGHFVDDRDPFRRRSRSRDGWWDRDRDRDRDFRDRDRDHPRDVRDRDFDRRTDRFDRRDDDRRVERDERDRPAEAWKKDGGPVSRPDIRIPSGPRSSSIPPSASSSTSRGEPPKNLDQPGPDQFRKIPTAPARDFRRDSDRSDIAPSRTEALREPVLPKGSPPPSAPQVPAFGSVTLPPTIVSTDKPPQPSPIPQTAQPTAPKADRPASSSAASVNSSKEVPKEAPTEPKALRNENNVQHQEPRPRRESISESWRQDIPPRVATTKAPLTGPAASPHKTVVAELSPPTAPAALLKRESALESRPLNDSFMSTSPPQGPASTSPILARAQLPPSGRGGSPQTSPRMSFSSVPTGPRAGVRPSGPWPSARGGHAKSKQWVRPGYPRGPPSTGGGSGPRREYDDRDPSDYQPPVGDKRGDPDHRDLDERSEKAISEKLENANADEPISLDDMPRATSTRDEDEKRPDKLQEGEDIVDKKEKEKTTPGKAKGLIPIPDFTRSSDEEDENEVFTEDYVQERKALFERSIRALKAELPPPTLQDPVIVDLLMKVQLLGMIADGSAPEEPEPSAVETNLEQSKKVLPAETYKTEMEIDEKESVTAPAAEAAVAPSESVNKELITVESLPFLNSGPLTPLSELDVYQENSQIHERLKETTRNALSKQRQDASQKNKQLREEFASFYRPWRMAVREMDDKKQGERKSSSPAASTPPVTPLPPPIPEGREGRRYKGNSELDFQNALRASAISAQEESERRRRTEATARPDLDREAVVPNMLPKYEVKPGVFKDSNNCVEVNDAFAVYGFYPPEDDFTPEEHKVFTDAFMAYPKKWGKIADELPGRTFSQCIMHYYLTKEEIKYKAKLNKRWRSQRRARKSTTRPKSNALMSDLKADGEDEETVQMTETGRPRRAAAPTFGGDAATEVETSRRGGAKDSDQGEKPASKRGRGGGPGTRGGRRGRGGGAQQQQQQQQQLPAPASSSNQPTAAQLSQTQFPATIAPHQPLAPATSIPSGVPLIAKQEAGTRDIHSAESMIRIKEHEREATEEFIPKPPRSSRNRTKDPIYVFEAAGGDHDAGGGHKPAVEMGGYGSMQPTSYWSVPEVRDFPVLLAHFGMDYDGIAGFMKTKTPVMVRNYYQRKLDSGNHEFEEIVKVAEAKKMRGEPTGPLPTPNPTPKRRYEATPSAVSHRPLAPHTDVDHPDDVRLSQKRASSAMSPPPVQMRPAPDLAPDRNMGRYPPLAQATAAPLAAMPDDSRAIRQSGGPPAPRPFSGPRMGFFTEGREPRAHSGTSTLAASRGQDLQPSPRVAATQGPPHPDFARLEPLPPQTLRSRVDMHVPAQYQQGAPPPLYMQQAQQGGAPGQFAQAITGSHSRHPSLNKAPGSPAQGMPKHTPDVSPIRRSSFGQSQPPPGHYQYGPPIHQSSTLSPVKEPPTRSSATPAPQEPPRQVPAKRSNIMSILNDDAEEPPPPRKRFASEMTLSPRMSTYGMAEPGGVQGSHLRHEEKPAYYASQAPQSQQAGRYSDYPSYPPPSLGGSSASGPPNHDWMARFDPRSQSQQPTEVVRATPTPTPAPASQYGSGYQPPSNSQPPTPSQSNPPSSSHRGYQGYQGAPTPPHLTPSGRDAPPPSSSSVYRHQNASSPQPRHSVLSYSSRQAPSPAQSPAAPMSIQPPRQSSGPGPYSPSMAHLQAAPPPSHPLGPQHRHSHSGHQSYQQHVQAMVSGQQQQQPQHSSRPSLGLSGGPPTTTSYTAAPQHGGPPPPHGTSRTAPLSNPPPQSLGVGRPFTPPAASVHAPPPPAPSIGGMLYPPNSSSAGHMQHHTSYSRHPEPSGPPPPPGHHRVYSQGGSRQ